MSNRPAIKMKVPVATLLDNARTYRDELIAEGEAKLAQYGRELSAYRKQVALKLQAAASRAANEPDLDDYEWSEEYLKGRYAQTGITINVGPRPERPDVVDRESVDRDIALLSATTEETLTLTVEDHFARYLRAS